MIIYIIYDYIYNIYYNNIWLFMADTHLVASFASQNTKLVL